VYSVTAVNLHLLNNLNGGAVLHARAKRCRQMFCCSGTDTE
jgi:hypothetical protein